MSATVSAGQSATYTLAVGGQGGFNQTVSFTCTGAPSKSTCTVSPSTLTAGSSATNITHGDDDRTFGQRATLSTASSGQAAITRARRLSHARLGLGWSGLDRAGLASARGEPTACHVPNARGRVVTDPGDGRMWREEEAGWRHHPRNTRGDILPDGDGQHGLGLCNPEPQPHPHPDRELIETGGGAGRRQVCAGPKRSDKPAVQRGFQAGLFREPCRAGENQEVPREPGGASPTGDVPGRGFGIFERARD